MAASSNVPAVVLRAGRGPLRLLGWGGPGDEVVTLEPYYDSYAACIAMAGASRRVVTLRPPEYRFALDDLHAAIGPRTRFVLLNSPHNPTGKVFTRDELSLVARLCQAHDVYAVTVDGTVRRLDAFHWGLVPGWAKDPKIGSRMINARAETLAVKGTYKSAFRRRRCIIPADGFYEWHTDQGVKTAYYIHRTDGRPLAFAGLWEGWKAPDDTWLRTCAIITGEADERLSALHPRMPIVLAPETWDPWLDRDERRRDAAVGLLSQPDTQTLTWHAVGAEVNNVRNDHPELITALAADSDHRVGQPRLG